jgi:hypothetical protein
MLIVPIKCLQHILNSYCRAIVKVRGCPPTLDQRGRVEFPVPTVPLASRPNILRYEMK